MRNRDRSDLHWDTHVDGAVNQTNLGAAAGGDLQRRLPSHQVVRVAGLSPRYGTALDSGWVGLCRLAPRGGTALHYDQVPADVLQEVAAMVGLRRESLATIDSRSQVSSGAVRQTPFVGAPEAVSAPPAVGPDVDLELWRWGTALAELHRPDSVVPSRCALAICAREDSFPCLGRVVAVRS